MSAPLLGDLPGDELHRLLTAARRRTFGRNEVVFHQGDPADSMHMIRKGLVRWLAKDDVVGQIRFIHQVYGIAA